MCGLVALFGHSAASYLKQSNNFIDSIAFRGRDEQGAWIHQGHICLLQTRLSIIDLKSGTQPLSDATRRYTIAFNGEIYNYKELREELEQLGATFQTNTDTEVILEAYKRKGSKMLNDLNGMFVFVIYDTQEQSLFVARDHLGKKPLFWSYFNGCYFFSSTLNTIKELPNFKLALNQQYLREIKNFGSSISNQSIWKNIHSFPMASYAKLKLTDQGDIRSTQYWHLDFTKSSGKTTSDYLDEYDELLTQAVKLRLRSDVPLCLTFSGGVDSGSIAAICTKKLNTNLQLFCIDYHTNENQSPEVLQAQHVANHLGLDLTLIHYEYEKIFDDLPKFYQYFDQPCIQLALTYSAILYNQIHSLCKVTLSGNGADELFTGYIGDHLLAKKDKILAFLKPFCVMVPGLSKHLDPVHRAYRDIEDINVSTLKNEMLQSNVQTFTDLNMYISLLYSTRDTNFVIPDIAGLSQQVEVRSPFLDYKLVEFAARLPTNQKICLKNNQDLVKYLPKLYYAQHVPKNLAFANKKGMGFNLQWPQTMARNSKVRSMISQRLKNLDNQQNLVRYGDEFNKFCNSIEQGTDAPLNSSTVMFGIMLSFWNQFASTKHKLLVN